MPSVFTHAFAALALGSFNKSRNRKWKTLLLAAACSVLPDADVISFAFGIPYESWLGHRGFTHSFFFAALLALWVILFFYAKEKHIQTKVRLFIFFFIATSLHPLLDACTNGGLGVALFFPFTDDRYFFPFRPIRVSPIGAESFFTQRGWEVMKSEFAWVWIPAGILAGCGVFLRRFTRKDATE